MKFTNTTLEALESIKKYIPSMKELILNCIKTKGRTCDEIEEILFLRHQTVSARIRELKKEGTITGDGQRITRSGRNAIVWRINVI